MIHYFGHLNWRCDLDGRENVLDVELLWIHAPYCSLNVIVLNSLL